MSADKCQIIFFGTPEFAVPTLKALIGASFCDVKMVVTKQDKPVGRHHSKSVPSPVKKVAQYALIPVKTKMLLTPCIRRAGGDGEELGVLVAHGDILPKKIIDSFRLGILNIHPSLLPRYRGSSPIQAAIANQDSQTGVTIMKLDGKTDHGPVVAQEIANLNQTETAGELHDKLAQIGADLLIKILPDYIAGKIEPKPQDDSKATYTVKLTKEDGRIDLHQPSDKIAAHVRAMNPWPGAWTTWNGKKLIIWKMSKTGNLQEIQLEGKKKMPIDEFLKGHPDFTLKTDQATPSV